MKRASYKQWHLRVDTRTMYRYSETGERSEQTGVPVVVISGDYRGFVWEASARDGRLASLAICPVGDAVLDQRALRNIPLGYIEEAAVSAAIEIDEYLAPVERDGELYLSVAPVSEALDNAARQPGEVRMRGDSPPLQEFAAAWRATPPFVTIPDADGVPQRISRRDALARKFYKSKSSIDKWTRAARDSGHLAEPPRTSPRPHEASAPVSKRGDRND